MSIIVSNASAATTATNTYGVIGSQNFSRGAAGFLNNIVNNSVLQARSGTSVVAFSKSNQSGSTTTTAIVYNNSLQTWSVVSAPNTLPTITTSSITSITSREVAGLSNDSNGMASNIILGIFIAVSNSNKVNWSENAFDWNEVIVTNRNWNSVINVIHKEFIAISDASDKASNVTITDSVMRSANGKTGWTSTDTLPAGANLAWTSLAFSTILTIEGYRVDDIIVAVSKSSSNKIMYYSYNNATWTLINAPVNGPWASVTSKQVTFGTSEVRFVALSVSGQTMYSSNGITWIAGNIPGNSAYSWNSIAYGGGLFFAIRTANAPVPSESATLGFSSPGVVNAIKTSPDGINWTFYNAPAVGTWCSVTFNKERNQFVSVSSDSNLIMYSTIVPDSGGANTQQTTTTTTTTTTTLSEKAIAPPTLMYRVYKM
jgi:hypothetical protein